VFDTETLRLIFFLDALPMNEYNTSHFNGLN